MPLINRPTLYIPITKGPFKRAHRLYLVYYPLNDRLTLYEALVPSCCAPIRCIMMSRSSSSSSKSICMFWLCRTSISFSASFRSWLFRASALKPIEMKRRIGGGRCNSISGGAHQRVPYFQISPFPSPIPNNVPNDNIQMVIGFTVSNQPGSEGFQYNSTIATHFMNVLSDPNKPHIPQN